MPVSKKNQLVGLDIGSHTIKLAEIDDSSKGMYLKNFGVIGLPQDAIVEGTIKEMEIVSSAIKNLFRNLKIKNRNVVTSISGYSVIVKKISIKKRRESELETTIQEEAEQYIPFDINDVNLDYEILTDVAGNSEGLPRGRQRSLAHGHIVRRVAVGGGRAAISPVAWLVSRGGEHRRALPVAADE